MKELCIGWKQWILKRSEKILAEDERAVMLMSKSSRRSPVGPVGKQAETWLQVGWSIDQFVES